MTQLPVIANRHTPVAIPTSHVETVVLLSQQKPDDRIEVEIELDELDLTSAESKATYKEIQEYVLDKFGLKVSNLYISQVKRKCGIEVGEIDELHQEIEQLKTEIPPEDNSSSKFETQLESIINMESFDREKIQKVIKKVIINGEDNIEFVWNTDDPFFK